MAVSRPYLGINNNVTDGEETQIPTKSVSLNHKSYNMGCINDYNISYIELVML